MARHRRRSVPRSTGTRRHRLLLIVLAPALVLLPMSAWANSHTSHLSHVAHLNQAAKQSQAARQGQPGTQTDAATKGARWSRSWSSPLALLVHGRRADFVSLPVTMFALGSQQAVASATFRTNWVDSLALRDGPNVAQQGLSIQPQQFKLQIMHGATAASHRGNCHVAGATGHVLAFGPSIDVADGRWHTITCIKYPDGVNGTKVLVIVDGVAGKPRWSGSPIGDVRPTGAVRLGGRSSLASTDSLDGWISRLSFCAT
jgi:hypothetical protein